MYFSNLISPKWDVFQVYSFYGIRTLKTLKCSREKLSSISVLNQYCYTHSPTSLSPLSLAPFLNVCTLPFSFFFLTVNQCKSVMCMFLFCFFIFLKKDLMKRLNFLFHKRNLTF